MTKEAMGEQEELSHSQEQLKMTGGAIEASILNSDTEPFINEEERLRWRERLAKNGVNFKPFEQGRAYHTESKTYLEQKEGTHASKFVMVNATLSPDKTRHLIKTSLTTAISQPGGAVQKGAEEEQKLDVILAFADEYLDKQLGRKSKPRFAPQNQAAATKVEIDEDTAINVVYRIEAITASAYVFLRTLAYDETNAEEATKFQTGKVAGKQLRERLIRGKARSFSKEDPERAQWEARQSDEKNVRHLPAKTMGTIAQSLLGWS